VAETPDCSDGLFLSLTFLGAKLSGLPDTKAQHIKNKSVELPIRKPAYSGEPVDLSFSHFGDGPQ
jgi:hypothetical protein